MSRTEEELHVELDQRFIYREPTPESIKKHELVRAKIRDLGHSLISICPDCRELSIALTKLEEVMSYSHASIARNQS
jgi:hypothetical protein